MAKEEPKDSAFEEGLRRVVRAAMVRHEMNQIDLQRRTGYSQPYISKWLGGSRGDRGASALFVARMFAALSLDAEVVFKRLVRSPRAPAPAGPKSSASGPGDRDLD